MTKQTTYDPYVPVDIFGHVSFTDRVEQLREKHGGFTHLSSEAIEDLAEPLKPLIGKWKVVFHAHQPVICISAYHGESFDMSDSDFSVIDNKAVLTNCGRYDSNFELNGITSHLNTFLAGSFNELVLATNKAVADSGAKESDAISHLECEAKQIAELYVTRFLLRHGIVDVVALHDKIEANPAYLGRIVGEVVWENQRSYASLALRNNVKKGVYPFPVEAPVVDDPTVKMLLSELEVMRSLFGKKAVKDLAQKAEYRITTTFEV